MKLMECNKSAFYYSLYSEDSGSADEYGNPAAAYGKPVKARASISSAKGSTETEQFGTSVQYDRVIITDDMHCPIDENTVLFVDVQPEFDNCGQPLGDYIVKRVAKSLNCISYAISRVNVS